MNRILTFMALSVWLAFGLAFKLVSDMTRTTKSPAPATIVVEPSTAAASAIEQTASLK